MIKSFFFNVLLILGSLVIFTLMLEGRSLGAGF